MPAAAAAARNQSWPTAAGSRTSAPILVVEVEVEELPSKMEAH
jgi:hypothetical protein